MEKTKIWDNMMYLIIALLLIGQVTVGWLFYVGQGAYLLGNGLSIVRDFKMERPKSDKIKNVCFFTITLGLIIIKMIKGV